MTRAFTLVASVLLIASTSPAADASQQPHELSVMVVAKSSNRNEVHYAVSIDDGCAARSPLRAYWRMRARGPDATEPLTSREAGVLGIGRQSVTGDTISFVVNGMPARTFIAHTTREQNGACTSFVETIIAGAPARVLGIYVKERLFGVDYVLLTGRTADGKIVDERLRP